MNGKSENCKIKLNIKLQWQMKIGKNKRYFQKSK